MKICLCYYPRNIETLQRSYELIMAWNALDKRSLVEGLTINIK